MFSATSFSQTRALTILACFKMLLICGLLALSFGARAQDPAFQHQSFGTFVRMAHAGPLCEQLVFDNNTSNIVSSGSVQCSQTDAAHNFQAPLASLKRGFASK
jgi:hypothetical protein